MRYVERDENGKEIVFYRTSHNLLKDDSPSDVIASFEDNASYLKKHRNRKLVYYRHIVTSFEEGVILTDEDCDAVVDKVKDLIGDEYCYYAVKHTNTKYQHLHILASVNKVHQTKRMHHSNEMFKSIPRKLEQHLMVTRPNLIKKTYYQNMSKEVNRERSDKNQRKDREYRIEQKNKKALEQGKPMPKKMTRQQLKECVLQLCKKHKTPEAFLKAIERLPGLSVYQYRGKIKGVKIKNGMKAKFKTLGVDQELMLMIKEHEKKQDQSLTL